MQLPPTLKTNRLRALSAIICNIDDLFFREILQGIEEAARLVLGLLDKAENENPSDPGIQTLKGSLLLRGSTAVAAR